MIVYSYYFIGMYNQPDRPNREMQAAFEAIIIQKGCAELVELLARYQYGAESDDSDTPDETGNKLCIITRIIARLIPMTKNQANLNDDADSEASSADNCVYAWMTVDRDFLHALRQAIEKQKDAVNKQAQKENELLPKLIETVYHLAPDGALNNVGRSVNNLLYDCWKKVDKHSFESRKAMHRLEKYGAWNA